MDKKLLQQLKGHLAKCECSLISGADVGDEVVLDGEDPAEKFAEMHAEVQSARQHLDAAHELLENDGDDAELAYSPMRRKSELNELDRTDVGAVVRLPPVRELGGAFLAQDIQAAAQQRLNQYWGWSR